MMSQPSSDDNVLDWFDELNTSLMDCDTLHFIPEISFSDLMEETNQSMLPFKVRKKIT